MIRVWLLIALVACSKAPRATHEEAPRPRDAQMFGAPLADAQMFGAPLADAQVVDAQMFDAPLVDARVVDAQVVDARLVDGRLADGRVVDARVVDARVVDARVVDARVVDARVVDAAPRPDAAVKQGPKLGKLGDVCAHGSRDPEAASSKPVLQCGPGLICCYPCGIQGCDSICKKTCPAVP